MVCRTSIERFQFWQRQHKQFRLTIKLASEVDNDPASPTYNPLGLVDITGYKLIVTIKQNRTDKDPPIVLKTTDNPAEILPLTQTALPWDENSTRGQARVFFVPNDTDPILNTEIVKLKKKDGAFAMDVWLVKPGPGNEQKPLLLFDIDIVDVPTDTF